MAVALDLFQLAAVAEILGAGSIVFALFFGAFQIQQFRRDRRDRAAAEMMTFFQTPEYLEGWLEMAMLPAGITVEEIRKRGPTFENRLARTTIVVESLGLFVFNRTIPLALVNQAMGGFLRIAWQRLRPWIEDERVRLNAPSFGEWFQWLIERLEESPALKKEPAHVKYRAWTP
ncbi:MAG TPA: hypothetical protein VGB18_05315 [Candidatus Thermoplasmatota archaeon]